jgi:hypothetical protein
MNKYEILLNKKRKPKNSMNQYEPANLHGYKTYREMHFPTALCMHMKTVLQQFACGTYKTIYI